MTTSNIFTDIHKCLYQVADTKRSFEKFISDKTVSLNLRWELFAGAPSYLKNTESYMNSVFDIGDFEEVVMYGGPVHAERYQAVDTVQTVEHIQENEELVGYPIDEVKERILAINLGSFNYDW